MPLWLAAGCILNANDVPDFVHRANFPVTRQSVYLSLRILSLSHVHLPKSRCTHCPLWVRSGRGLGWVEF